MGSIGLVGFVRVVVMMPAHEFVTSSGGGVPSFEALLRDIQAWLPLMRTLAEVTGLRSAPVDGGGPRGFDEEALPFGLHRALDFHDEGAFGMHTREGVREVLDSWAGSVAADRGHDRPDDAVEYLLGSAAWMREHWPADEVEAFSEDVLALWRVVRRSAGRDPVSAGDCPRCGGGLSRELTDSGVSPLAVCADCGGSWDAGGIELGRARLAAALRGGRQFVPIGVVLEYARILGTPGVTADLVRQWAHRKHVRTKKRDGQVLYSVWDIFSR